MYPATTGGGISQVSVLGELVGGLSLLTSGNRVARICEGGDKRQETKTEVSAFREVRE